MAFSLSFDAFDTLSLRTRIGKIVDLGDRVPIYAIKRSTVKTDDIYTSHVIASESSFIVQDAYWEICKMTEVNNLFGNLILVM